MEHASPSTRSRSSELSTLLVCVALLVVITVLRIAVSNPIEAVGFLYVIPISMLASELGVRGGLLAGVGAIALTIFWALIQDVPLGLIGYGARTGTFLGIGLIVGLQAQRRLKLQADRERLIAELHATAMRDQAHRAAQSSVVGRPLRTGARARPSLRTAAQRRGA